MADGFTETATTFDTSTVVNGDGTFAEGWRDKMPDHVKTEIGDSKYFDSIKDLPSLVKSAAGLSKLAGRRLAPKDDATPEEWDRHFAALGVPDKPEDYGLGLDGVESPYKERIENAGTLKHLGEVFKAAGVPKPLAAKLATASLGATLARMKAWDDLVTDQRAALAKKWGSDAALNGQKSTEAMETFATAPMREFFDQMELKDHPVIQELFYEIGRRIAPGRVVTGAATGKGKGGSERTPLVSALGLNEE